MNGKDFGKHLFRFVVIADTHCNHEEEKSTSPYAANALANPRARHVISELNELAPAFVLHLGDIVNPVPELRSFVPAVEQFKSLASQLKPKLYLIPGNHDVGDKPVAWMPAGTVTMEFVEHYRQLFGDDYYSFDSNGCHFVMINAQIINSGLAVEDEQREWLEKDFELNATQRVFVCIHYPPYVSERNEASSYDNIDEPGRSWLIGLIERYEPEAIFCGHVHNFWYDLIGSTECYLLPSTAFVRQDYSELYHVGPGAERGRNEVEKLGYFIVEVYEEGHVAHFEHTHGKELKVGACRNDRSSLPRLHTKLNLTAPVGVDLRHPWQEVIEVAATGGVQEFERKKVRNDYPLAAMWEMGLRKLRIPLHDLLDENLRRRMRILRMMGHEFIVHHFGFPDACACEKLVQSSDLVSALEIVLPAMNVDELEKKVSGFRKQAGFFIYISKLRRLEDSRYDGSHFNHFVNHGFVVSEHQQLRSLFGNPRLGAIVDGVVIRIARQRLPWEDISAGLKLAGELGVRPMFHVRLAGENPAVVMADARDTANRIAETLLVGFANPGIDIVLDTFDDIDRGYFCRDGLVDRRSNLNPAGLVFRHLQAALGGRLPLTLIERNESAAGVVCRFVSGESRGELFLPGSTDATANGLSDFKGGWVNLVTGMQNLAADRIIGQPAICLQNG